MMQQETKAEIKCSRIIPNQQQGLASYPYNRIEKSPTRIDDLPGENPQI